MNKHFFDNRWPKDSAGRVFQTIDPMGIVNQTGYDNANRTTQTIEDYSTSHITLNRLT